MFLITTIDIVKYSIAFVLLFLIVNLVVLLAFKTRKIAFNLLYLSIVGLTFYLIYYFKIPFLTYIYFIFLVVSTVIVSINITQELRDLALKEKSKYNLSLSKTNDSKDEIIAAVFELSRTKTGAIITIESHNTLDHFSKKAIELNADIRKELLLNIFVVNTPLHDGAVIIRGNKILCAGAYFVLTDHDKELDKTTGSRHRAAKGISEITDSFTIVCSEETGTVSIAIEGALIKMKSEEDLDRYLSLFLKN